MNFDVTVNKPREKDYPNASIDVAGDGTVLLMDSKGKEIIREMHRVHLESISVDWIHLSGMEPDGFDRSGSVKYRYNEWFLGKVREKGGVTP